MVSLFFLLTYEFFSPIPWGWLREMSFVNWESDYEGGGGK